MNAVIVLFNATRYSQPGRVGSPSQGKVPFGGNLESLVNLIYMFWACGTGNGIHMKLEYIYTGNMPILTRRQSLYHPWRGLLVATVAVVLRQTGLSVYIRVIVSACWCPDISNSFFKHTHT